jgi:hypothetical protein
MTWLVARSVRLDGKRCIDGLNFKISIRVEKQPNQNLHIAECEIIQALLEVPNHGSLAVHARV